MVSRWRRHRNSVQRIRNENTLKAVYQIREKANFAGEGVAMAALGERMRETETEARYRVADIVKVGMGDTRVEGSESMVFLNPEGWLRACAVVRNHRLWELYLTNQAEYQPDHVHDDAEKIEHILGEDTVRQLERLLDFPARDPHGKLIPSLSDLQRTLVQAPRRPSDTGYRMPGA